MSKTASSFDTYCSWLFVWELVIRTAHSLKHLVHQKAVLMDERPLSAQSSFYSGYLIHVKTLEHLFIGSLRRILWGQASPQQDAALAFLPDIACSMSPFFLDNRCCTCIDLHLAGNSPNLFFSSQTFTEAWNFFQLWIKSSMRVHSVLFLRKGTC